MIIFLSFALVIRCYIVVKFQESGCTGSNRSILPLETIEFPVDECILFRSNYIKFTFLFTLKIFESSDCSELNDEISLQQSTCTIVEPLLLNGSFDITEELNISNTSDLIIFKHYEDKLCNGEVQYISYFPVPTEWSDLKAKKVLPLTFLEENGRFLCNDSIPYVEFKFEDESFSNPVIMEGCSTVQGNLDGFTTQCNSNDPFEYENMKINESVSALWTTCYFGTSQCNENNYSFAMEFKYEYCLYDNTYKKFFKYVGCSENHSMLKREYYSGYYCKGEVEFMESYFVFQEGNEFYGCMECNLLERHERDNVIEFETYFDEDCIIQSDRTMFAVVEEDIRKTFGDYLELEDKNFSYSQGCVGEEVLFGELRVNGDDGLRVFYFDNNITDCMDSSGLDFLKVGEDNFPFILATNPEMCRTCDDVQHYKADTCSGHGICYQQDMCKCDSEYAGTYCAQLTEQKQFEDFFKNYWWIIVVVVLMIILIIFVGVFSITLSFVLVRFNKKRKILVLNAPLNEDKVTIIFTDIVSSTKLYEKFPEEMYDSAAEHNRVIRELIKKYEVYEVKTIGDAFMIAGEEPMKMVCLALDIMNMLPLIPYPPEFLESEMTKTVKNEKGDIIYRGIRIRIGINTGPVTVVKNNKTHTMDYFGNTVNIAARIEATASNGCIFISKPMYDSVKGEDFSVVGGGVKFQEVGEFELKGIKDKQLLYCVHQKGRSSDKEPTVQYKEFIDTIKETNNEIELQDFGTLK